MLPLAAIILGLSIYAGLVMGAHFKRMGEATQDALGREGEGDCIGFSQITQFHDREVSDGR